MPIETIVVANIAEAFEKIINKVNSSEQKKERIRTEHNLCERALLWEKDDKIIITPFPVSKSLISRNTKILGLKNVHNLAPRRIDISLSDAIMRDKKLMNYLCDIIGENPGVRISPYCVTKRFLSLINFLKKKKLNFVVKEIPHYPNKSLVTYLDSKVGSRLEISRIKGALVKHPMSLACKTTIEAIKAAQWFYNKELSCVVKSDFGESGWGLIIIDKNRFRNSRHLAKYLKEEFKKDPIWDKDLILVEKCIHTSQKMLAKSPSVELFVSDKGPKVTYVCNQILGDKGNFLGVALGKDAIPVKLVEKLTKISLEVGIFFWRLGYRGFFDVDFVISKNGIPYVIETNTRRTGGTHAYDVVRLLFGNNWKKVAFVLAQDNFRYGDKILSADEILDKMKQILYPMGRVKEGAIISIINKWQPCFGFIIISNTREKVQDIYNKMLNLWELKINEKV